jgi:hypothetical protein
MIHSSKLTFVANMNNLTCVGFAPSKAKCLGSLEFTTDCFGNPSLSPKGNDSGVIFMGMVHNRSPSRHTILEESYDEGHTTSGRGGISGFPNPQGCNMVTQTIAIATTPPLEGTLAFLTIPTVRLQTVALQLGTGHHPEQQQAYQEE